MRVLVFCLVVLFQRATFAQVHSQWLQQKIISWGTTGYCVSTGANGNIYVSGSFSGPYRDPGPTDMGCFLTCYSSSGSELWHREFYGDRAVAARNVVTASGDIILAGMGLRKISSEGNLISQYDEEGIKYIDICFDKSNNTIIVVGSSVTKKFGGFELSNNNFISRLTPKLEVVMVKDFFFNAIKEGYDLFIDDLGNIYSTGGFGGTITFGPNVELTSQAMNDVLVVKIDQQFAPIWAKSFGGIYSEFPTGICVNSSKEVYVTGKYYSPISIDSHTLPAAPQGGSNSFIAKFDADGNCKWLRAITGEQGVVSHEIVVDKDDNIFVTGYFYGAQTVTWGNYQHTTKADGLSSGVFLAQADAEGNAISLTCSEEGSGARPYDITCDNNVALYLTGGFGGTLSFGGMQMDGDGGMFLMKLSYDIRNKVGVTETKAEEQGFKVYPSPGSGRFTVVLNDELCEGTDIFMYDASGKCIKKFENLDCGEQVVDCTAPCGIYFMEMRKGDTRQTRKVVIQ